MVEAGPDGGQGEGSVGETAALVDLQVNGFAGVDFNTTAIAGTDVDRAMTAMAATGVGLCLPTVITAADDDLLARFAALDRAIDDSPLGADMAPGYHLEGPFLNPGDGFAGCHPPDAMAGPADYALVERIEAVVSRPILMITIAPERPGALEFIARARAAGKLVALGHTAAGHDRVEAAVAAGARLSTHLGNGLPQNLPKLDNPLFAQLAADGLSASFIADGVHLPPFALKAMLRAKGPDRALLVTDAVAAAAMPPGRYPFAGMTVERHADGVVRQAGSPYLAGSALCMDQAVRNLVAWRILGRDDALRLASTNPMALLAPVLAGHGITPPPSSIRWRLDTLQVAEAVIGGRHLSFPMRAGS